MVPTDQLTRDERAALETPEAGTGPLPLDEGAAQRQLAIKQVERVRSFRLHAAVYMVGVLALGGVWV